MNKDVEKSDRISELYKGLAAAGFSKEAPGEARERIHWICRRAEGKRIVDIGCSQGIISILLVREGFDVVGVDADPAAIAYANTDKEKETPESRERLNFVYGNIYDVDLPQHAYHTAIMGEFLEHQARPDRAVARAHELLADDGKLIVTVPFGLFKDPGHKQTFYTASLHKLLSSRFLITEAEIIGRYLCLQGKKRPKVLEEPLDVIELALVEKTEDGIQQRVTALTKERDARKREVEISKSEQEALTGELEAMKKEGEKTKSEDAALARELDVHKKGAEISRSERDGLIRELEAVKREAEKAKSDNEALTRELEARKAEAEKIKSEQQTLAAEISKTKKHAAGWKTEKEALTAEVSGLKRKLGKTKAKLDTTMESLPYRFGYAVVQAFRKPGYETMILPWRLMTIILTKMRKPKTTQASEVKIGSSAKYEFLQKGIEVDAAALPKRYTPHRDGIFYLIHNSLPFATGGYSIRTHGLSKALAAGGWQMCGVTRLGFPFDISAKRGLNVPELAGQQEIPPVDVVDRIPYRRILDAQWNYRTLTLNAYLKKYLEKLFPLCTQYKPALLHGASNFVNGIVAASAARILGLPCVYEVRGLWEMTRVSKEPNFVNTDDYENIVKSEAEACRQAQAVITLTQGLKKELVDRGVPGEKIMIVPNGVDTERFVPKTRDRELEAQLGFEGKKVIGYIGAFAPYEGLEYLLQAAAILRYKKNREDFRIIIIGDGVNFDELQTLRDDLKLRPIVTIKGRVSHDVIHKYYSLIDIVPIPRLGVPVCEIVSPLKPFEAMAMGKAVVASNVAALAEIVRDNETGLLHRKDDVDHLAQVLETLLDHPELARRLGDAARRWVVAERDWRSLARSVGELYRSLIKG